MKVYKYFLKNSGLLFAMTMYKQLADEFEYIYNMDKFVKQVIEFDSKEQYMTQTRNSNLSPTKLWYYTCESKDVDELNICMTDDMHSAIKKAAFNIISTIKSAYITSIRFREVECMPISNDLISATYELSADKNHFGVDTYKIWIDLYADIINETISKDVNGRAVDSALLLGIYKYDNNQTYDESSIEDESDELIDL